MIDATISLSREMDLPEDLLVIVYKGYDTYKLGVVWQIGRKSKS